MDSCIFCRIVRGEAPSWKVLKSYAAYAFLDIHPVSRYHTLVIPKAHYVDIFDAPALVLQDVMNLIKEVTTLYRDKLGLRHVQLVNSSGAEAQQDVFHIHFHIVPRRKGDGQNIQWRTYPEMRGEYDAMVEALQ